jgi:preprotein translocase subunit SecB
MTDAMNNVPQIRTNVQYVKDLSFENPNAPVSLLNIKNNPSVDLNLDVSVAAIQEDTFEVSIRVNAGVKSDDMQCFVLDLTYAGIFTLLNIPEEQKELALLVTCPTLLFPFARSVVSNSTREGGFQPLMIDPVDFYSLYLNKKQTSAADETTLA